MKRFVLLATVLLLMMSAAAAQELGRLEGQRATEQEVLGLDGGTVPVSKLTISSAVDLDWARAKFTRTDGPWQMAVSMKQVLDVKAASVSAKYRVSRRLKAGFIYDYFHVPGETETAGTLSIDYALNEKVSLAILPPLGDGSVGFSPEMDFGSFVLSADLAAGSKPAFYLEVPSKAGTWNFSANRATGETTLSWLENSKRSYAWLVQVADKPEARGGFDVIGGVVLKL